MSNKLQQLRELYEIGDRVLVFGRGHKGRKAIIRAVESGTVRVEYQDKRTGEYQRVHLKDIVPDPDYPRDVKADPSKAKLGDVLQKKLILPPKPVAAVRAVPVQPAPFPAPALREMPKPPTVAAVVPPPPSQTVEQNLTRLSTWLKEWRTEKRLHAKDVSNLTNGAVLDHRIYVIERRGTAADDDEIKHLASMLERMEPPGVNWFERLKAMRDQDVASGVFFRVHRVAPGFTKVSKSAKTESAPPATPAVEPAAPSAPAVATPAQSPTRLSLWLDAFRKRRGLTNKQIASKCGEAFPVSRIVQVALCKTAAEDDEILALAAYLESVEEPGTDWIARLMEMRDNDIAIGIRYRSRKISYPSRRKAAAIPEAPKPTPSHKLPTELLPSELGKTEALPPIPVAPPPSTPAVINTEALRANDPAPAKMSINVGGVQVEGSPEDIRRLLGLK